MILILYCVNEVFAVSVLLLSVIAVVEAPVGYDEEPYTRFPASLVISILLVADALDKLRVIAVIISVPESVWKVNALTEAVVDAGASVADARSFPEPSVVEVAGVNGEPDGMIPDE
mgnify:CR=1 FL=1